jgi:hypothetical protein
MTRPVRTAGVSPAVLNVHDFFLLPLSAPHFAAPGEKEPDLLDRSMGDRLRCFAWPKLEMGQSAAVKPKQDPHVGVIRGDGIGYHW